MAEKTDNSSNSHPITFPAPLRTSFSCPSLSPAENPIHRPKIDADDALKVVQDRQRSTELDNAAQARLLRRIDAMIMPVLCIVYGLNFLDKTTLSYASVTGIDKDLNLTGDDYNWLGSTFYFGYLGWEFLAARLLQRLPLAKYNGVCIIAWGIALTAFAAVKTFTQAVALRLLLGIFEASVSPGWTLFTSQWYTKREQGVRTAYWVSFNGFAGIFGSLIAYGFTHHGHGYHLAPWRIIYLFTGLLTIISGVVFLVIIPDSPLNAWWLDKSNRQLAIERIRINQQGIGNKTFKLYQLKEALFDPIVWAFVFLALTGEIPNGGITNFFNLLIISFGYTTQQSLLYGTISGAIQVVTLLCWAYTTHLFGNRISSGLVAFCISLLGSILLVALPSSNSVGRLVGFYLAQFFVVGLVACISLIASNVAGYTKKTTVAASFFIAYAVGNIVGPQTFRPKDAPRYTPAKITLIVCYSLCILDLLFIYGCYVRRNKAKARVRDSSNYQRLENQEFLDLTDKENSEFVYEL